MFINATYAEENNDSTVKLVLLLMTIMPWIAYTVAVIWPWYCSWTRPRPVTFIQLTIKWIWPFESTVLHTTPLIAQTGIPRGLSLKTRSHVTIIYNKCYQYYQILLLKCYRAITKWGIRHYCWWRWQWTKVWYRKRRRSKPIILTDHKCL